MRPDHSTPPSHDVTVIGAGAMGMPMAQRLLTHGLDVAVVDPSPVALETALTHGLSAYQDISLVPPSGVVVVTVATGPQLIDAVSKGATRVSASSELWVICSTVGPAAASESAAILTAAGSHVVDAPMTGVCRERRTARFSSCQPETRSRPTRQCAYSQSWERRRTSASASATVSQ